MPRKAKINGAATDYAKYFVNVESSIPRRLADFLVWAAKEMPKRAISLPQVAKVVLILPKTPKIDGKEIDRLRNAIPRARQILLKEHRRGLLNIPGSGLRATLDSEDLATSQFERAAQRVVNSIEHLDHNRAAIKLSEISDTEVRTRVSRVSQACKTLTSGEVLERLRLPAPPPRK